MTRLLVLAGCLALFSVACAESRDKAPAPAVGNELRGPIPGPPGANPGSGPTINVARGGVPDDSVKPKPTVNIAKGGIADDTIKPRQPGQQTPTKPPR